MLNVNGVAINFDGQNLFSNVNLQFLPGNCYGIIGANGAGKSTFLRILSGDLEPSKGEVTFDPKYRMSVLKQDHFAYEDQTIFDTIMQGNARLYEIAQEKDALYAKPDFDEEDGNRAAELEAEFSELNGWDAETEAAKLMQGLGLDSNDMYNTMSTLNQTEKVKVLLARALFGQPDMILLDEPTNGLDAKAITWLEDFLIEYEGTVIVVSHDRYFLDRVVTKVVEVDNKKVTTFEGNYTAYSQKKAMLREAAYHAWVNQQQEIHHQEEVIAKLKSFNREKSIKRAESREKMLDKMDVLEKPTEVRSDMRIRLEPRITSGNDVLTVEHLSKAFPGQTLFQDLNFEIKRGERVAIIGNNGTGKTTILKILNEVIRPDAGSFTLGSRVQIGYYDQEHQVLHMEKTIFQEISDAYPYLTNTEIRNVLAAFLFTNDDVFQPIHTLSGGERGRISLAKLMLSNANFLILDEPTNHLDIVSKEILENALKDYTGTVLYVSHDRYFINQTATRILELTGQTLVNYIGNYDYYLEKKEELTRIYAPAADAAAPEETAAPSEASSTKLDWKAQKEEQARLRKKENELKKTEKRIEELETRDSEIDEEMSKPEVATNVAECVKLSKEKAEIAAELEELYEKWEELAE